MFRRPGRAACRETPTQRVDFSPAGEATLGKAARALGLGRRPGLSWQAGMFESHTTTVVFLGLVGFLVALVAFFVLRYFYFRITSGWPLQWLRARWGWGVKVEELAR